MNRLSAMETFIRVIDACSFSDGAKQLRVGPAWHATAAALDPRADASGGGSKLL
jgi:hypothetical protein